MGSAIPWLKAEAKVGGEGSRTREAGQQATLSVISNAYRHLLALAIHYATEQSPRLVLRRDDGTAYVAGDPNDAWFTDRFIQESPRAMLFIDLPDDFSA